MRDARLVLETGGAAGHLGEPTTGAYPNATQPLAHVRCECGFHGCRDMLRREEQVVGACPRRDYLAWSGGLSSAKNSCVPSVSVMFMPTPLFSPLFT